MEDQNKSLSLDAVRDRFLDAEKTLNSITNSLSEVDSTREQLGEVKSVVAKAAEEVSKLAEELSELSESLKVATKVVRDSDPSVVLKKMEEDGRRVDQLLENVAELMRKVDEEKTAHSATHKEIKNMALVLAEERLLVEGNGDTLDNLRILVLATMIIAALALGVGVYQLLT